MNIWAFSMFVVAFASAVASAVAMVMVVYWRFRQSIWVVFRCICTARNNGGKMGSMDD